MKYHFGLIDTHLELPGLVLDLAYKPFLRLDFFRVGTTWKSSPYFILDWNNMQISLNIMIVPELL